MAKKIRQNRRFAAIFLVLGVDTFNSENLNKNKIVIIKCAPDMASPIFLQAKRHISPTPYTKQRTEILEYTYFQLRKP